MYSSLLPRSQRIPQRTARTRTGPRWPTCPRGTDRTYLFHPAKPYRRRTLHSSCGSRLLGCPLGNFHMSSPHWRPGPLSNTCTTARSRHSRNLTGRLRSCLRRDFERFRRGMEHRRFPHRLVPYRQRIQCIRQHRRPLPSPLGKTCRKYGPLRCHLRRGIPARIFDTPTARAWQFLLLGTEYRRNLRARQHH